MPTWSGILEELQQAQRDKVAAPFDYVRRKYLRLLNEHTRRNIILYASSFTQMKGCPPEGMAVADEDMQGLMEVVHGLPHEPTDLILHSPGGSAEAAESLVEYLHEQYPHVRAVVPQMAMSAATMIASGMNQIVLGKHSCLGPIDPQVFIASSGCYEPAQAIIDQFNKAIENAAKPGMEAWAALFQMYGPSLIVQCEDLIKLAKELVASWLTKWMFAGELEGRQKAESIAEYLGERGNFRSHGRHLRRDALRSKGLVILDLEMDQKHQDLVLSVFHATTHTFSGTTAVKIIENHLGKAFIKMLRPVMVRPPSPEIESVAPPLGPSAT
jgi:hypothetical protein